MTVHELYNILAEVTDWAHLVIEPLSAQVFRAAVATQIALLPRLVRAPLVEGELLGEEAPHVVVFSYPLAVPTCHSEGLQILCRQELQSLL